MEDLNKETKLLLDAYNIRALPSNPNYWLIRTESGSFYEIFKKKDYVSIGFDKIDINDIGKNIDKKKDEALKEKIATLYPDYKKPGLVLSQLRKFLFDIEKGDIIIIPSKNSRKLCVGQAISAPYQIKKELKNKELLADTLTYMKRIDVKWIAEINKNSYDIYIYKLLSSHQAIVSANSYKNFINRMIFPIYYQDGKIHLCFNIKTEDNISLDDTYDFYSLIKESIDLFNELTNSDIKGEISVKSTVNSAGMIEFLGHPTVMFAVISILIFLGLCGGKINVKYLNGEFDFNLESAGLIQKLLDWYKEKNNKDISKENIKLKKYKEKSKNTLKNLKAEVNLEQKTQDNIIIIEKENKKSNKKEDPNQQSFFDD